MREDGATQSMDAGWLSFAMNRLKTGQNGNFNHNTGISVYISQTKHLNMILFEAVKDWHSD